MQSLMEMELEDTKVQEVERMAETREATRLNRRSFLTSLGAAGAGAAALSTGLAGCSSTPVVLTAPPPTNVATPGVFDVLNFALNLEYLEASFYLYVTTGSGLAAADMGTSPGTVTGGAKFAFTNPVVASVAAQLANDEKLHVEFLRSTITAAGGTPVSMPSLNLAAMGAITSDASFVALARQLETVGVSAYAGGAQYLTANKAALTYAAQILHTESQHESFLRQLCLALQTTSGAVDALDIPPTSTAIFNTSATTGLYTTRTPSQVLQIVFGAPGMTGVYKGGFFPTGLNGTILVS